MALGSYYSTKFGCKTDFELLEDPTNYVSIVTAYCHHFIALDFVSTGYSFVDLFPSFCGFRFSSLFSFMIRPKRQLHASLTVTVEERIDSEGNSFCCHYVMCWWQMSPNTPGVHFSIRVMQHGWVPLLPSCLTRFFDHPLTSSLSVNLGEPKWVHM